MHFTKMQGCGNDYVYVNCFEPENKNIKEPEKLAQIISDRHFGVGSDGLILIEPSNKADAFMNMFNADGSKAMMCGNGIRCTAKYIYDHGIVQGSRKKVDIDTRAGVKNIELDIVNNKVVSATVDMGIAKLSSDLPEDIFIKNMALKFIGVDIGNPHAVYFLEDNGILTGLDYMPMGKCFENHARFPDRVNSEFIEIMSRDEIKMRVWERGSGETFACGTGAAASAFAGFSAGKLNNEVLVHLLGGDLKIKIMPDNRCYMTGPAVEVFEGDFDY